MSTDIKHDIIFSQTRDGKEKSVSLLLSESFRMYALNGGDGSWKHGRLLNYLGDDVHLYRHFSAEEKKRLVWNWNSDTFVISVGIMVPTDSHKGGKSQYYREWITLHGAKRAVTRKFSLASGLTGAARYELAGSSDTFNQGSAEWQIVNYA